MPGIEDIVQRILDIINPITALSRIADVCGQAFILLASPCSALYKSLQQIFVSGAGCFTCPAGFSEACYECSGVVSNTCGNALRCCIMPCGYTRPCVACYRIPANLYGGGEICNWLVGIPSGIFGICGDICSIPFSLFDEVIMVVPRDICGICGGIVSIISACIPCLGMLINLLLAICECACWFTGFLFCGGACKMVFSSCSAILIQPSSFCELCLALYEAPGQIYDQCLVCCSKPTEVCKEMFGHDIQYMCVEVFTDICDAFTDPFSKLCLAGETLCQPPPVF